MKFHKMYNCRTCSTRQNTNGGKVESTGLGPWTTSFSSGLDVHQALSLPSASFGTPWAKGVRPPFLLTSHQPINPVASPNSLAKPKTRPVNMIELMPSRERITVLFHFGEEAITTEVGFRSYVSHSQWSR